MRVSAGRSVRRVAILTALLAVTVAAGCSSNSGTSSTSTMDMPMSGSHKPVATTDADWKPVTDALGRTGKFGDNNTVYRIPLVRSDLHVQSQGVDIKPGLSLGGYAAFGKYDDGAMVMGDLVVTEEELPKVTDALHANGLRQTALHKHLLGHSPQVWWTHIEGMGDPAQLGKAMKAVLDATSIAPAAAPPAQQPPVDIDTAGVDAALGRKGTADGGLFKYNLARAETISDSGHVLPPTFGVTTVINFQPTGAGGAAVNGDFALTTTEVDKVIEALRKGGIDVVELHNHMLTDDPHIFFLHYWAVDDAVTIAKTLRTALDATNLAK
ncbi:DUF1259 domain-containing protein [Nocardia arthritidis]|uniref:DUF1259 domain-containing protein n=1 Tax=Nocardia arthritidis TaxID=228602 RepID=A0A6G9Y6Q7_9NOCA|nr:DUF1259 domain-containing protein [Nocardia arthritidis]QIS08756.1 DUF1259 domain-containing protein [Nocardia arthritidis]